MAVKERECNVCTDYNGENTGELCSMCGMGIIIEYDLYTADELATAYARGFAEAVEAAKQLVDGMMLADPREQSTIDAILRQLSELSPASAPQQSGETESKS